MIDSLLIGPIVGALGGLATQWFALKAKGIDQVDRKDQREHEREMLKLQHAQAVELARTEAEYAERRARIDADVKVTTADLENLNAAIQSMPRWSGIQADDSPSMRWFKTIIEAMATLVRVFITGFVAWKLWVLVSEIMSRLPPGFTITPEQAGDLVSFSVRGFTEFALTALSFWFGSRGVTLKQQETSAPPPPTAAARAR